MYKVQEKTQEFVQCLNLPGNKEKVILESLDFLKNLNTDDISVNSYWVAILFCTIMCNCTDEMINELSMVQLILESYDNIKDLDDGNEGHSSVEITIMKFLKRLNNLSGMTGGDIAPIDEEMQMQFNLLCSKLEEMKIIFKLQHNGIEIFPIGKLLAVVIGSEYIFEKLDEVTLNTFLLALEIFDTETYAAEKDKLDKIIDECNLKCLEYLSDQSTLRIGGSAWKENFKRNGVLILGNVTQGMIYIRHPEKVYFSSLKGEKRNKLDSEKNSEHRDIAYFYEDSYDFAAEFMSIRDIMTSGNPNLQIAAIREIYNNKSYNVFFDKAFIKVGDNVQVVNQFTAEDTILIFENGEIRDANVSNITEYAMKPFSLIKIIGEGLDYVILGSICKLLRICNVQIDSIMNELKNVHKNYQDNLIVIWSKYTTDFYKSVLELQKEYFEDVLYIKKRKTILQKGISDISWIPVKLPIQFLENKLLELCGETIKDRIEKVLLEKDEDFEGNVVYRDIKNNIEIPSEFLVMKQDDDLKKDIFFSIKYQDRYFVSNEIDSYIKIMRKIEDDNKELNVVEDFALHTESQIQLVLDAMKLQEEELNDIDNCIVSFNDIAKLRIIHHILCNKILTDERWGNFIGIINAHQQLKYDFIKNLEVLKGNVLIVPKEKQESDSVMTSIINRYCKRRAIRNHDAYLDEIGENQEGYTYMGQKIEKIIFLFDTIQSGTSTIRNLQFYFEYYDKTTLGNVKNQHVVYYYRGKEIKLETIIEKNHPTVEIVALYGSKVGIINVEQYLESNVHINNKKVICMKEITRIADKDFMDKVQQVYNKNYTIEENDFPVIREFNQPKKNAFPKDNLAGDNIASIFVKKKEHSNIVI